MDSPTTPEDYDWSTHYPSFIKPKPSKESTCKKRDVEGEVKKAVENMIEVVEPPEEREEGEKVIEMMDIGCGYGGLTVSLSSLFPDKLILAVEIR